MLCTDRRYGRFSWGLDWDVSRCSRKFYAATADVRKRKFHCAPCDPRVECRRVGALGNRVFPLGIGFHFHCALHEPCGGTQGVVRQRLYSIESSGAELAAAVSRSAPRTGSPTLLRIDAEQCCTTRISSVMRSCFRRPRVYGPVEAVLADLPQTKENDN
jgi:hypothetical protein